MVDYVKVRNVGTPARVPSRAMKGSAMYAIHRYGHHEGTVISATEREVEAANYDTVGSWVASPDDVFQGATREDAHALFTAFHAGHAHSEYDGTCQEGPAIQGHANLCDCCLIWLANNEACDCPPHAHPTGLLGRSGDPDDALGTMDLTATDERDDFSWAPCEGCTSWAGGARTRVAVWA